MARSLPSRWRGVGNLHLDTYSANLTSPIFKNTRYFRCKLAQFGGDGCIAGSDGQRAKFQAQYLAALREIGWGRRNELLLQDAQGLSLAQYRAELRAIVQQGFEWLGHNFSWRK